MTLDYALDLVVARTKHARYRRLAGPENPNPADRARWADHVLRMAAEPWPPAPTAGPCSGCPDPGYPTETPT